MEVAFALRIAEVTLFARVAILPGLFALQRTELERADVGTLVLFLLHQTFLEFTLLLEAVLLGHLALLFIRLHGTAFLAELAHLAVEHLVLTELTLQAAIIKRYLDAGLQANLVEALFPVAEHPGIVARKLVLQPLANHLVGSQQVGRRDALAVGRIGHQYAFLLGLLEVLEVLLGHGDVVRQSGRLDIDAGGIDSLDVHVIPVDMMVERTLPRVVVVYLVEEVGIEVRPLLKGKLLAEESRRHVAGDERRLNQQCAAAAHGVDEVGVALPSRHQYHACCQHLVQWSLHRLLPVPSPVQRLAAGVETQRTLALARSHVGNVYVQPDVRV